ncbi:Pr6Pr family membrane protein [Agromyces allii]|uniref:Pr6Pr family membrane protein n=1 Tax=Agromyces allii TaxID=393607 RepID=A0ABN2R7T9_9MICO|nr:Pr6Pr family membrane protein [Agromyces allii]
MPAVTSGLSQEARTRRARMLLGVFRLAIVVLEIVALVGNFRYVLGFRSFATANFFSYFTIQSAFLAVITLTIAAVFALSAPRDPAWLGILRTCVTVYVVLSGIVFAIIVAESSSHGYRVDVPWSDTLLHFVVPALAVIAWSVDSVLGVNPAVPWSTVGWVLPFPVGWLIYTLIRGADVGWYPYFFLDEAQVGSVVGVVVACTIVLAIFLALTATLVAVNRWLWRTARDRRARPTGSPDPTAARGGSPALRR